MKAVELPQDDLERMPVTKHDDASTNSDADSATTPARRGLRAAVSVKRVTIVAAAACVVGAAFGAGHHTGRVAAKHDFDASAVQGLHSVHHSEHAGHSHHGHSHSKPKESEPKEESEKKKATEEPTLFNLYAPTEEQRAEALKMAEALSEAGKELTFPTEVRSPVTLRFEQVKLPTPWLGGYFWTRGYNGGIPGPTIRVKPGETLEIILENTLGPGPGYEACNFTNADIGFFMNPHMICALNHTNLHTHGLHVSGMGKADNIMNTVAPGETMKMVIPLPENHMPGTHFYHPHHHHATAAQAGGGAHGALIVDDPPGYLPKAVEDMEEKIMFLSLVNVAKEMRMEAWGMKNPDDQKLWINPAYPNWKWDLLSGAADEFVGGIHPMLVVNGQFRPKLTLQDGKWYRLRFVFAAIEQRVEIYGAGHGSMQKDAFCQYQLISKDGIYLHEAPRAIERIYLASGSRADVAVSCTCQYAHDQTQCHSHLMFHAKWQPMGVGANAVTMEETKDDFMMLNVVGGTTASRWMPPAQITKLPTFQVRRPCYLADTRGAWVKHANKHKLHMPMIHPMTLQFDGKGQVWGHNTPEPRGQLPVGEVQEWEVDGIRYHPFHLHVNSYQIVQMWDDPYFIPGDWQDTMLPSNSDTATIRFHVDRFVGKMVGHCHLLEHEDNGMMAWWNITGEEGTFDPYTQMLDPNCYNTLYPGPPPPPAVIWR